MRLWSIHPRYLDQKGLVALWREGLLAQKVLQGKTKGYKKHAQLIRFKAQKDPVASIARYLRDVADEATVRGYNFDRSKLAPYSNVKAIPVTKGQIDYEMEHLVKKLKKRNPEKAIVVEDVLHHGCISTSPSFIVVEGDVESWEKT